MVLNGYCEFVGPRGATRFTIRSGSSCADDKRNDRFLSQVVGARECLSVQAKGRREKAGFGGLRRKLGGTGKQEQIPWTV